MSTSLSDRILRLVSSSPGLTDREITDELCGAGAPPQSVNSTCRRLAGTGKLVRRPRRDGLTGNYRGKGQVLVQHSSPSAKQPPPDNKDALSEDAIKQVLDTFLGAAGWSTQIAWGRTRGVDIEARRGTERWLIEVKDRGSLSAMRVNYFLGMLGELLQRMDDPNAKYAIAMPDLQQFRRLWERLPALAKQRTAISAIFVDDAGNVDEVA